MDSSTSQKERFEELNRRSVIKGAGLLGLATFLPVNAAAVSAEETLLGDFEQSLDGWKTNGGTKLRRFPKADLPYVVDSGDYALEVAGKKDPMPMIRRDISETLIAETDYLVANAYVPRIESSKSSVTFEARYWYNRSNSGGNEGGPRRKTVETLSTLEVPQQYDRNLVWDLSSLSKAKRSSPNRLELVWYQTDAGSGKGPNGRGSSAGYGANVYFSKIYLTNDQSFVRSNACLHHLDQLRGEHGFAKYTHESFANGIEKGRFEFTDGTTVPLTTQVHAPDRIELTLDGTTYKLGGGWQ